MWTEKLKKQLKTASTLECLRSDAVACVAMILRRKPGVIVTESIDLKDCEMLFILRAENENDRWGGHVAFPGGRQAPGETDLQTCKREVYEEIGLELDDNFDLVGKSHDCAAFVSEGSKLIVKVFVFMEREPLDYDTYFFMQDREVQACGWCPIDLLIDEKRRSFMTVPIGNFIPGEGRLSKSIRDILNIDAVCFTLVKLNIFPLYYNDKSLLSRTDQARKERKLLESFQLWGLTLRMCNDFLYDITRTSRERLTVKDYFLADNIWAEKFFAQGKLHNFLLSPYMTVGKLIMGRDLAWGEILRYYPYFAAILLSLLGGSAVLIARRSIPLRIKSNL